jgi:hypothetical protein
MSHVDSTSEPITINIPEGKVSQSADSFERLNEFRKLRTPDPFVNSVLTSLGKDVDGNERFWISYFLVDEVTMLFFFGILKRTNVFVLPVAWIQDSRLN